MVFSNDTLLARYHKRAADTGGSRPQPRQKKQKTSSDPPREERTPREAGPVARTQEKGKGKAPQPEGGSSAAAREPAARARPASGSQRGRQVVRLRRSGPEPGSGLGVPSSSRPRPPSSSGANPPSSSRSGAGPERRPYRPEWLVFEDDRALDDALVARDVIRCAILPADRARLEVVPIDEFVDQAYCSAIRHLHEIDMLVCAASNFQDRSWEAGKKLEAAEKKAEEAEARAKEATARVEAAEAQLRDVSERLQQEEGEHALSRSALRGAEARSADLASELAGQKYENSVLRLKLDQLELRAKSADERVLSAVETFRRSAEYQDELAEEAVDGLIRGFEDFRAQAQELCPDVDFSSLQPRLADVVGGELEAELGAEVDPSVLEDRHRRETGGDGLEPNAEAPVAGDGLELNAEAPVAADRQAVLAHHGHEDAPIDISGSPAEAAEVVDEAVSEVATEVVPEAVPEADTELAPDVAPGA